jgi:hypothetical protein
MTGIMSQTASQQTLLGKSTTCEKAVLQAAFEGQRLSPCLWDHALS